MSFKILILNKDNDFHRLIKKWDQEVFKNDNYTFFYANTELEAIDILNEEPEIDLILGDVSEDDEYYAKFLDRCQISNPFHNFVLISDQEETTQIKAAMDQGTFEHLVKPLHHESLKRTIHRSQKNINRRKDQEQPEHVKCQNLKDTVKQTVAVIGHIGELKDPYTAGHQKRVAHISKAIAQRIKLDDFTIEEIFTAALLHDVGKITIPSEILSKPGGLSTYEMALVRQHAIAGKDILKDITFPWDIKGLVGMHHERLDGSGYPDGLSRNEIPLGARIIAIADVFEAVSSFRPYRPALGIKKAVEILKEEAAQNRLDSVIVSACLDLIESGHPSLVNLS